MDTDNLIKVLGVKPGQRAILVDNKAILIGVGGREAPLQPQPMDLSFITASAQDVLATKVISDRQGQPIIGSMPDNTSQPFTIRNNNVVIPRGYNPGATATIEEATITQTQQSVTIGVGYNPTQKQYDIRNQIATDLSFVTASSSQILAGYVGASTNGSPVNGSIQHKYSSDVALNPEGSINIPKGYYQNTDVTLPQSSAIATLNVVTTTVGWSKGQLITVGTSIEGGQINPTTTDQTIAKDSFLASDIVIKGQPNFTQENIAEGVTLWGKTGTHSGGSDIDLSFVTATADKILAGYVGASTNGNPVNGSIQHKYSSDVALNSEGSISIPKGYYQNTEVTLPQSTTTVASNQVATTIGWSKGQITTVGTLIEGGQINPATTDQIIAKNSFLASDIVVKGQQNFTQQNIAEGVTMWGKTGTFKGGTTVVSQNIAGVLVDDGNGGLKVQKLNFDGTVASDDGQPVTAQTFYIFNTGKDEPDYVGSTGSSMEIYKCAEVDTENKTWCGYLYNIETREVSDILIEGLQYEFNPTEIGKFYTADGVIECDVFSSYGMLLYYPLTSLNAVTRQIFSNNQNAVSFTSINGVKCGLFNGNGGVITNENNLPTSGKARTITFALYKMNSANCFIWTYGECSSLRCLGMHSQDGFVRVTTWGPDYDFTEEVIPINTWVHYAVTFDSQQCSLYRNGSLVNTLNVTGTDDITVKDLYVGGYNAEGSEELAMAEFKIFTRFLSPEEIKAEADRCLAMVTE